MAGGKGTRLYPLTHAMSKQLLPIYDKPMIYYPLSVLMLAGIRDVLVISTYIDLPRFQELLGDGSGLGIHIEYALQEEPNGLPEAFIIGEEFIANDSVCMILGDNIFYGQGFVSILKSAASLQNGAKIFGYKVKDAHRFGVIEFDANGKVLSLEEKPLKPKSNYAITGIYFFDNKVIDYAKSLSPSDRGELEIISLLEKYLQNDTLYVDILSRGFAWLDTGTHDSLMEAGQFVQTIEHRQGYKIACLEEIAYGNGWISRETVLATARPLEKSGYGKYLIELVEN